MSCSAGEDGARSVGEGFDRGAVRFDTRGEHLHLEARPAVLARSGVAHGLHDEVDVSGLAAGVRPQADVDLIRVRELTDDVGRPPEQVAQLGPLAGIEFPHVQDVADRHDDQRPDAQRTDAVTHEPASGVVDHAAGKVAASRPEVAGEAAGDVAHDAGIA
jgi:hypothetical protein